MGSNLLARMRLSNARRRVLLDQEHASLLALAEAPGPFPNAEEPPLHRLPAPRVSVIMPVYNGGRYFELALASALNQTYPDLEIVVVDDGSTDGVAETLGRRAEADHPGRVRYLRQANGGACAALNTGVGAMTGDVFCWLSHDDLFTPDKTAVQVEYWRRLGRPDAMLISDYGLIDGEGRVFREGANKREAYAAAPRLPLYRGGVHGCTTFIPASVMRSRPGPFDPALRYAGDYALWLELLRDRDFLYVPQVLVYSRHHAGQDSHRPQAAAEGELVWGRMIDALSEVRRAQLYGSGWRFLDELHRFLSRSPYTSLAAELAERRDRWLAETLVSVVLPFADHDAEGALAGVLAQTHRRLEVLLPIRDDTAWARAAELARSDPRVRPVRAAADGLSAGEAAIRRAGGTYIALAHPEVVWPPERLGDQLRAMATAGADASLVGAAPGAALQGGAMFHRGLTAAGWRFGSQEQLASSFDRLQRLGRLLLIDKQ